LLDSIRHLPYAWWNDDKRKANANNFDNDWNDNYFWVVRGYSLCSSV
jgi:hypothetical protein